MSDTLRELSGFGPHESLWVSKAEWNLSSKFLSHAAAGPGTTLPGSLEWSFNDIGPFPLYSFSWFGGCFLPSNLI